MHLRYLASVLAFHTTPAEEQIEQYEEMELTTSNSFPIKWKMWQQKSIWEQHKIKDTLPPEKRKKKKTNQIYYNCIKTFKLKWCIYKP